MSIADKAYQLFYSKSKTNEYDSLGSNIYMNVAGKYGEDILREALKNEWILMEYDDNGIEIKADDLDTLSPDDYVHIGINGPIFMESCTCDSPTTCFHQRKRAIGRYVHEKDLMSWEQVNISEMMETWKRRVNDEFTGDFINLFPDGTISMSVCHKN